MQTRRLNEIENFIVERILASIRRTHIEMFILFSVLNLACLYCVVLLFFEHWFISGLFLLLFISISSFLFSIWFAIKGCGVARSYLVQSEKGTWAIEYEGSGKARRYISKVNGKEINMPVPGMIAPPEYGQPKDIQFEYVKILGEGESLAFGSDYVFISIDGNKLNEKHRDYVDRLMHIGVFSLVLIPCFITFLIFSFISEFKEEFSLYICLFLFIPFLRTIIYWKHNSKLRKNLEG